MLSQPVAGSHYAQLYQDTEQLAQAVGHFITNDLSGFQAIVIIATPVHTEAFCTYLTNRQFDITKMLATGQLRFYNAETLLDSFMLDGKPNGALFLQVINGVFKETYKSFKSARIFGEMVDILWQADKKDAAIVLESYWNSLLKSYNFSLLCAYRIDNLDIDSYTDSLECVCKAHTHLVPSQEPLQLEQAILTACESIVELDLSSMKYSVANSGQPTTLMPSSQASLFHIRKTTPMLLKDILNKTKIELDSQKVSVLQPAPT